MEIRVLGPFEVSGVARDQLGGRRQQSLLVVLALSANTAVPRERLIDLMWGEPPPSVVSTLQGYVSHLRKALASLPAAIDTTGASYRLTIDPTRVDAIRFERRVAEAADCRADGQEPELVRLLSEALSWWRGPALSDFLDQPFAGPAAAKLNAMRLSAHTDVLRARLRLGEHEALTSELELMVGEHPLHEDLWALLMVALYRCGRQADALTTFRRARSRLIEEIGVEPGPALRALETAVLHQDAALSMPPAPRASRRSTDHAGWMARPASSGRPPTPLTSFVGRGQELTSVIELLRRRRSVTLVGPGGVGKTRLALEAANRSVGLLELAGVAFADLAGARDASDVERTVAGALSAGSHGTNGGESAGAAEEDVLLLLDNCEQVAEPAAKMAMGVLHGREGLRLLCTSRQPLQFPSEAVWLVPPLDLPSGTTDSQVLTSDAVSLFLQRAGWSEPGFVPNSAQLDAVVGIVTKLDGVPLALELAASAARMLPLSDISDRLDQCLEFPAATAVGSPPRHHTMTAAMEWSYRLLQEPAQLLLRRLGVFHGGFDLLACEQICADETLPRSSVFPLLATLVHCSLVEAPRASQPRPYRMLHIIQTFARQRLDEDPHDASAVAERHARFHLQLARNVTATPAGGRPQPGLLQAAEPDLSVAMNHLSEAGRPADSDVIREALTRSRASNAASTGATTCR